MKEENFSHPSPFHLLITSVSIGWLPSSPLCSLWGGGRFGARTPPKRRWGGAEGPGVGSGGVSQCVPPLPPPAAPSPTSAPSWLRAPPGAAGWGRGRPHGARGGRRPSSPLGRRGGGGEGGRRSDCRPCGNATPIPPPSPFRVSFRLRTRSELSDGPFKGGVWMGGGS